MNADDKKLRTFFSFHSLTTFPNFRTTPPVESPFIIMMAAEDAEFDEEDSLLRFVLIMRVSCVE